MGTPNHVWSFIRADRAAAGTQALFEAWWAAAALARRADFWILSSMQGYKTSNDTIKRARE